MHRRLVTISRVLLLASNNLPARAAGTVALGASKILENMEIGHNVLHGQWDSMMTRVSTPRPGTGIPPRPPRPGGRSHNYVHHTFTNIRRQGQGPWLRYHADRSGAAVAPGLPVPAFLQPAADGFLRVGGVALHDSEFEAIRKGEKSMAEIKRQGKGILGKAKSQVVKDYIAWPLLSGLATAGVELALETVADRREPGRRQRRGGLAGSLRRSLDKGAKAARKTAKAVHREFARNVWAYAIIFCGHFPEHDLAHLQPVRGRGQDPGRLVRAPALPARPTSRAAPALPRRQWQPRAQVEHHLFPDLPSTRYAGVRRSRASASAPSCLQQRPVHATAGNRATRTILQLALPGGQRRPKPGHEAEAARLPL